MLEVLTDVPRTTVQGDLLGAQEDRDRVVVGADDDALTDQPGRDRVQIAVEAHAEALGHARALDIVGVEGRLAERPQEPSFNVLQDQRRHLAGHLVHAIVGERVAPRHRLGVEVHEVCRPLARDSVAEGIAARNWADRVKPPPVRGYTEERPNMLGPAQLRRLLGAVPPSWRTLVGLMALTGLRWGEASALRWEDLDDDAGVIRIRRGNWRGQETTPKTDRSRRVVPMPPGLGRGDRSGWMFPTATGRLHKGTPLRKVMQKACTAAGVPYTTPHGLRRSFNNLARQVTTDQILKSMLGHTTDAMTEHYSLVGAQEKRAAQSRVLELIETSADERRTSIPPEAEQQEGVSEGPEGPEREDDRETD